ncbi:hypothetical protein [Pseudomonas fluorescens]|uniref:hypothetical protein n=1 Tax=Pseudomonas fluorescens TaxID=294 RepID=UPI00111634D6|nr:hypothetical protein [Pseudomonas fluorescens]
MTAEDAGEIATAVPEKIRVIQMNHYSQRMYWRRWHALSRLPPKFDWPDSFFDSCESARGARHCLYDRQILWATDLSRVSMVQRTPVVQGEGMVGLSNRHVHQHHGDWTG